MRKGVEMGLALVLGMGVGVMLLLTLQEKVLVCCSSSQHTTVPSCVCNLSTLPPASKHLSPLPPTPCPQRTPAAPPDLTARLLGRTLQAWILPAIQADSAAKGKLYYIFAALYAAPLLRSGFDVDTFTWLLLFLGILHSQVLT